MGPATIDHFLGQPHATAQFRVALEAAWSDGTRLPHMLLAGPPGCGKTLLAHLAAKETGAKLHESIGQVLDSPGAVNGLLAGAHAGDVVFVDEIHETPAHSQTLLFRAMEDRRLFVAGRDKKAMTIPLSDFCLVAATTDEYAILSPLRDRFKMVLHFKHYESDALKEIVLQRAQIMGLSISEEIAHEIAIRSKQTPRLAIRLLESCHRLARSRGDDQVTMSTLEDTIVLEQLDHLGLDANQQRYLQALADRQASPVRLHTLESILSVHRRTIQTVIEPFLLRSQLADRTPQGRVITQKGQEHIRGSG